MPATLEHVNFTVTDPKRTAELMCNLFDWKIRWQGDAISGGYTYHVGDDDTYLAIYSSGTAEESGLSRYRQKGALNHVGVVVVDLDAAEARVRAHGYEPVNHADYEPGRRFYFLDHDGIEFEVVSYA